MKGIVTPQGVAADQLGQPVGLMRGGRPHRSHLHQLDLHTPIGQLEGTLTACQTATDDGHRALHCRQGLYVRLEDPSRGVGAEDLTTRGDEGMPYFRVRLRRRLGGLPRSRSRVEAVSVVRVEASVPLGIEAFRSPLVR